MRARWTSGAVAAVVAGTVAAGLIVTTRAIGNDGSLADSLAQASTMASSPPQVIGRSVRGRPIVAQRYGSPSASRVAVIVGAMHGNELAGFGVVRHLRRLGAANGTAIWLVRDLNPDGSVRGQRKNARGVDLNRNSPHLWRGVASAPDYYPGRRAMSEPETRTYVSFLRRIKPDMVIVFHQRGNGVDSYRQKSPDFTRGLASRMGLPVKSFNCTGVCRGTLTGWINASLPGTAITVELPDRVSSAQARRYAIAAQQSIFLMPDH